MKNPPDDETAEARQKLPRASGELSESGSGIDATRMEAKSRVISSMSIAEIGPHLREVALRCVQLAREAAGTHAAQELEEVGIELAVRASSLEGTLAGAVVKRLKESIEAWTLHQPDSTAPNATPIEIPGREPLTRRESDVLSLIVAGASSKEAGRRLGISPRTVEFHRARILEKVDAKNTAALIRIVMSRHSAHDSPNCDWAITEIGPYLREVALRCIQLAREAAGTHAARELEDASVELTDRASSLEGALALWIDPDSDAER